MGVWHRNLHSSRSVHNWDAQLWAVCHAPRVLRRLMLPKRDAIQPQQKAIRSLDTVFLKSIASGLHKICDNSKA